MNTDSNLPHPVAVEPTIDVTLADSAAVCADRAPSKPNSYGQILRSSALIGGASAIGLLISLVRTKAMALLLGPAGFGLMGVFTAIADLTRSVAEVGINSSGVRQIAESAATGDSERVARTALVLRRIAVILGVLGATLMVAASPLVSEVTFGNTEYAGAVALLSAAVLLRIVSDGQGALLQGTRRIADLARVNVYGAAIGGLAAVPLVYMLREEGVVPAIVAIAGASLLVSWWYSRKVPIVPVRLSIADIKRETRGLLRLGVAFMVSGVLMMGAAYFVRIFIIRHAGLDAAGLYQAAWAIGGLYIGLVLQAMGADFYPRLVGAANDHPTCNRLVNEQATVSILLGGAGVVATIALAPLVLTVLYSDKFVAAAATLRWICLGMALRVVTWPIGYIIVAKGRQTVFVLTEIAWTIVNVGLSWLLVIRYGPIGAGMAFFGSYVFHALMIYPIVSRMSSFRWTGPVIKCAGIQGALVVCGFLATQLLNAKVALVIGLACLALSMGHSAWGISRLIPVEQLPRRLQTSARSLRLFQRRVAS